MTFDKRGRATSSQDTLSAPDLEHFAWQKFFASDNVAEAAKQERARTLVFSVLSRMQRSFSAASMAVEVDVVRGGGAEKGSRVRVLASKTIPPRALRLVPLVKSTTALTLRAGAVWQLPVHVAEGEEPHICVYVQGGAVVPSRRRWPPRPWSACRALCARIMSGGRVISHGPSGLCSAVESKRSAIASWSTARRGTCRPIRSPRSGRRRPALTRLRLRCPS